MWLSGVRQDCLLQKYSKSVFALHTAQPSLSLYTLSFFPFTLFSAPLKLCLPILQPPFSFCALTLSPAIARLFAQPPVHTDCRSVLSCYPRSCHFSEKPIHINRPQWAISYPSVSHHPPFSAFGITILSESFIYPFSSSIPFPIISSSLPSMTHSSARPIYLSVLFFSATVTSVSLSLHHLSFCLFFLPNLHLPSLEHNKPTSFLNKLWKIWK